MEAFLTGNRIIVVHKDTLKDLRRIKVILKKERGKNVSHNDCVRELLLKARSKFPAFARHMDKVTEKEIDKVIGN